MWIRSKIINVDENDEAENLDKMITNSTFINPSQFKKYSSGLFLNVKNVTFYHQENILSRNES
jgi:hypothetical protein